MSGLSKFCIRQPLKGLKRYGLLKQTKSLQIFKGYLPQNLLSYSLILCFPCIFNAVVTRTLLIVSFLFLSLYCSFQKKEGTTLQTRLYLNIVFVRAANSAS